MSRLYTSKDEIERYLLRDIDASFDVQVEDWIKGATTIIENTTGRVFGLLLDEEYETVPQEQFYDGHGGTELLIDDAQTIETVEMGDQDGENFVEIDDFIPYPKIAPHRKLIRRAGWDRGIQNIKVEAAWGHTEEVPKDIRFVATVIVAGIINASQNIIGKKSESIGNYSVTYADDKQVADFDRAMGILDSYVKYAL